LLKHSFIDVEGNDTSEPSLYNLSGGGDKKVRLLVRRLPGFAVFNYLVKSNRLNMEALGAFLWPEELAMTSLPSWLNFIVWPAIILSTPFFIRYCRDGIGGKAIGR